MSKFMKFLDRHLATVWGMLIALFLVLLTFGSVIWVCKWILTLLEVL